MVGIDLGLIATTLAQPAFKAYMFPIGTENVSSLVGAIVSIGSAGVSVFIQAAPDPISISGD